LLETTVTPAGYVSSPRTIASGWSRIDDPAVVARGQRLTVVFPGTKTDSTQDPTDGLDIATSAAGQWSLGDSAVQSTDFADSSVPSLVQLANGTLLQGWSANGDVVVHVGVYPTAGVFRGFGAGGNVALAATGSSSYVGWCASGSAPGIFVRAAGASGPVGATLRMPSSQTSRCPAATRTQLVVRAGGGVYVAASVSSERAVRVWKVGSTSVITVSDDSGIKQQIALAAAPDGRLWVGWRDADSGRLLFRRSNPSATEWGAVVSTAAPAHQDGGVYNLDLAAQADRVDAIARTANGSAVSIFHTQMLPGLSVRTFATPGHVTVSVTDAGDPVRGATVRIAGHLLRTARDGLTHLDLSAGSYPVAATKSGYVGAATRVRVNSTK
jgi:hypothetical protein